LERVRLLLPRKIIQGGSAVVGQVQLVVLLADLYHLIWLAEGQGPQHHGIDNAEDSGVSANGERDRQDNRGREHRRAAHHAQRIAKIGQKHVNNPHQKLLNNTSLSLWRKLICPSPRPNERSPCSKTNQLSGAV